MKTTNDKRFPTQTLGKDSFFMRASSAFTLIELLVVVLIIGVLAAIAVPQYQKSVFKSKAAEPLSLLPSIARAHQLCVLEDPTNCNGTAEFWDSLTIDIPGAVSTTCAEDSVCLRTSKWEYGTAGDGTWIYAYPIENGTTNNNFALIINTKNPSELICSEDRDETNMSTYKGYGKLLPCTVDSD